uniref:Uncharacterized protein n=1 Tax=Syphacia muris TaxID=451379 RepID=A0A0N5AAC1_9BILA
MAIEYFDDNIVPNLQSDDPLSLYSRSRNCFSSLTFSTSSPLTALTSSASSDTPSTSRATFSPFNMIELTKINEWRKNVEEKIKAQENIIAEQGRIIKEQGDAVNHIIKCLQKVSPELSATYLKTLSSVESSDTSATSSSAGNLKRKCSSCEEVDAKKGRTV